MPTRRKRCAAALAGAAALLVSGCGSLSADEVTGVAAAFAGAKDDPATRCRLLADNVVEALVEEGGASCEVAIQDLPVGSGDVRSVEVWGQEAQARLTDDTVFLTRTAEGWRITAAACQSQGSDLPYQCRLEGS
jgi:hypothetical protein